MLPSEHWQLSFLTLNSNLAVNLKTTHPLLLKGRRSFTFLKTKSSHSSSIFAYPPKFEFYGFELNLEINSFWETMNYFTDVETPDM